MNNSIKTAKDVELALVNFASKERAQVNLRFFKTGVGQYGFGDQFIGVTVPHVRIVVSKFLYLTPLELEKLLHSPLHEVRLCALLIMVSQYKKGDLIVKQQIFDTYIANTKYINNWDLVDLSASHIVGAHLEKVSKKILHTFALSDNLWERRIAMLATFHYIMKKENSEAFKIIKILLHDPHDLIQKAVGWMLREIGKRSGEEIEENFLMTNYQKMPRTMLRYAIERFSPEKRQAYLKGKI